MKPIQTLIILTALSLGGGARAVEGEPAPLLDFTEG